MTTKKRTFSPIFILCMLGLLAVWTSCQEIKTYDPADLVGVWANGGEHWRYRDDGTGCTWNTDDDVTESEAQEFTWTLVQSTLTQIHIIEISGTKIPKVYTVTELTSSSLSYEDDFGKVYSFYRVK